MPTMCYTSGMRNQVIAYIQQHRFFRASWLHAQSDAVLLNIYHDTRVEQAQCST